MRKHLRLIALIVVVLALLPGFGSRGVAAVISANQADAATRGGTQIVNTISATYQGVAGDSYTTVSNTVDTTIALLGSLVVSPKDTTVATAIAEPLGQPVTLRYHITNTSNISDAYTVQSVSMAPACSCAFTVDFATGNVPVTLGSTVSETLAPDASTDVLVTVTTTTLAVNAQVPVTLVARTTQAGTSNGLQSDTGEQWFTMKPGASISGPHGPNSKISKTVDQVATVSSQPGSTVTFDIVAMNNGGSAANNVVVTDPIPVGLTAEVASVRVDGQSTGFTATLVSGTLSVHVPSLAAGGTLDVSFDCVVTSARTTGLTFVNTASVSADGLPDLGTTPASVLIGSADIVFDGYAGSTDSIGGAVVTLLDSANNPVNVNGADGSGAGTANPFVTGPDGSYSFDLDSSGISPTGSRFYITIAAPGYLNRRIQLDITPGSGDPLYNVTVTSLDQQPLAVAGGFTLTSAAVSIANIYGFFGNLPLFRPGALTVTKSVDRQVAQAGDRLAYTIDVLNSSPSAIGSTQIVDTLPSGVAYAPGTAKLDGVALEPTVNGRTLTWSISSVAPSSDHVLTYDCVIFPSVAPGDTLTNSVAVTGTIAGTQVTTTGTSAVTVTITGSAFSQRQVITGRVFIDAMKSGHFRRGDTGVAGVRVFMEDGSSVVTDTQGRFDFPAARPGMHVLRLDPATLPAGVHSYIGYPMNSTRATQQLVHGIFDNGTIEDVQFALEPPA